MISCKGHKDSVDIHSMSTIYVESDSSKELTAAADDCIVLLNKASSTIFSTTTAEHGLINCTKKLHSFIDPKFAKALESESAMSFALIKHNQAIWIYSTSDGGLKNGLYYLLEKLGYRFYFPGDLWTKIPHDLDLTSIEEEIVTPDFTNIEFFGGGGLPPHKILDPSNKRKKTWDLWKSRMRFGNTFTTAGHIGEAFNKRNKTTLLENPEYLALIDGKRQAWKTSGKLCNSNPDARKLFVQDRITEYKKWSGQFSKEELLKRYLSVEPADGINHCTCESCKKMGSISDRVFTRANEVAKELENLEPNAKLCILAYNQHAAIPSIPIHKNIYVSIVPYAFQQVAVPEKFISDWVASASQVGIRDYIGTPPWQYDLPGLDFLKDLPKKMRYWKSHNILDIKMESSYSIGATGIPLYMYNRLAWNLDTNPEEELKTLCTDLFLEASEPMLRMFTRWSSSYKLPYSLELDWQDLKAAKDKAKKEITKKRLTAFHNYLVYIEKFNLLLEKKEANIIEDRDVEDLLGFMWTIHDSYFVHSTFMNHWILRQIVKSKPLTNKWSARAKDLKIETWESLKKYKPQVPKSSSRSKSTDKIVADAVYNNHLSVPENSDLRSAKTKISLNQDHDFHFYKSQNQTTKFKITAKSSKVIVPNSILTLFDVNDDIIESINLDRNDITRIIDWSNIPSGKYRINLRVRRCIVHLDLDDDCPLLYTHNLNCLHCPSQLEFIPSHDKEQIIAQIGKKKVDQDINNVYGSISRNKLTQTSGKLQSYKPVANSNFETINGNGFFKF